MKKLWSALILLALIGPAAAGPHGKGTSPSSDADQAAKAKKAKETERAYQEALKKIPDSTKKQDPWGNMR